MFGRKAILVIVTAAISASLLGGAALAAFAPQAAPADTFSLMPQLAGATATERGAKPGDHADKLKDVLDALVKKAVITQAQEDSILASLKDSEADHRKKEEILHGVFKDLFTQSATYLGMTPADLKSKLPGTSLAAIANATTGKSRDGLVAYLTKAVDDVIAKLLADGKITKEQADKATAEAPGHIAKFVDHKYSERKPQPERGPKVAAFLADANKVVRDYLGLADADLNAQLRSGKSLGEIAIATPGKSRDGLVGALTQDANAKLDKAKADGKITADQLVQLQSEVSKAINALVDRKGKTPAIKSNANAAGATVNRAPTR